MSASAKRNVQFISGVASVMNKNRYYKECDNVCSIIEPELYPYKQYHGAQAKSHAQDLSTRCGRHILMVTSSEIPGGTMCLLVGLAVCPLVGGREYTLISGVWLPLE